MYKFLVPFLGFAIAAGYLVTQDFKLPAKSGPVDSATFPLCNSGKRYTCTVDGDTVWLRGEKIRLKGIDAPEKSKPKCRSEAELARKATRRLKAILSNNEWVIERGGEDRYGRTLAVFWIGDQT
ncbi:MAG: thermonuclease family protein [Gammaproteobacteria bacterium]|nr:thermonuclease family protein [Gammaproteobacteria bacterium]